VWLDRSGREIGDTGESGRFENIALSPSGRRVAFGRSGEDRRIEDHWQRDLDRGITSRLTFHPGADFDPVWSPDETRVAFNSGRKEATGIYVKPLDSSEETLMYAAGEDAVLTSWSPDGKYLLFSTFPHDTHGDIWILPVSDPSKAAPWIRTSFYEEGATFSPDGRWVAYVSSESGQDEIYVREFPSAGKRLQISMAGGFAPRWRGDGREIFYITMRNELAAVQLEESAAGLKATTPVVLFELPGLLYDAAPDGQRFLAAKLKEEFFLAPVTVVLNWANGTQTR
jgi:Tol biopolymer transport system component